MTTPVLAVKPNRLNFDANDDKDAYLKLQLELKDQAEHTELFRIGRAVDAAVYGNGLILNKYRMTTTALHHLCGKLCPGLGLLSMNLALIGDKDNPPTADTVELAIRTIDEVIKVNYRHIDGCSWVIDHRTNRIEGLIGRKYRFVSNWELLQKARDYVLASAKDKQPRFAQSILYGRRMLVRFKDKNPAFHLDSPDGPDVFYGGFHFANSEIGGYAIRAATMVLRQLCDNKAVSPFTEGGKLAHLKGKKFDRKFNDLLEGVSMKAERLSKFRDGLLKMRRTNLGLGGTKEKHAAAVKSISRQLRAKGLTAKFAETVIDHVISQGSYSSQRIRVGQNPIAAATTRNLFDLFNAITAEAKQLEFSGQEEAEQVAYRLIRG